MSGGGGMGMESRWRCLLFGSHRVSLKDGRGLHDDVVGVAFSAAQGALDLFLAQPFVRRYEVPREDCEDRYRTKDGARKVERRGRDRVKERRDRDLYVPTTTTTSSTHKIRKYVS